MSLRMLSTEFTKSTLADTKDPLSLLFPRGICEKYTSHPFSSRKPQRHSLIYELMKGVCQDVIESLGLKKLNTKINYLAAEKVIEIYLTAHDL